MTLRNRAPNEKMPDASGRFGPYGGRFAPETLMPALIQLQDAWKSARRAPDFRREFETLLKDYAGRPSPLYYAERLTEHCGGARIYFKRDELNHTGSHKINNCLGQALLARRMGKTRLVAETGAGQHGVAAATVAARFGMQCVVYMGAEDMKRQRPNLLRMQLLGAEVRPVRAGSATLKDAMNEAMRDWASTLRSTHYLIGSAAGPHPYPALVREFQSVIGKEARRQIQEKEGRLPSLLIACVGGGSNAIGLFHPFLEDTDVAMHGVEAAGASLKNAAAAALTAGRPGILHGARSYLLQTADGQVCETNSISAGLDYPSVGPEHAFLRDSKRVRYVAVEDARALAAFRLCARLEGILPALEPAHALAHLISEAPRMKKDAIILMNMCGRGDKDIATVMRRQEALS